MWTNQRIYENHSHYVVQIPFGSNDNNTFPSVALDRTTKMWQKGSNVMSLTFDYGLRKFFNCLAGFLGINISTPFSFYDWDIFRTIEVPPNNE